MTLGARIRLRREYLGLSQSDLAVLTGYTDRSSIAKIESGKTDLTQSKVAAFAEALHTTPGYLMGWSEDPYDYERDEDSRFSEIPSAQLNFLIEQYGGDMAAVWRAWQSAQEEDAPRQDRHPISRQDLQFALWGGAEEMDDEDLQSVLDYADYVRARKAARKKDPTKPET